MSFHSTISCHVRPNSHFRQATWILSANQVNFWNSRPNCCLHHLCPFRCKTCNLSFFMSLHSVIFLSSSSKSSYSVKVAPYHPSSHCSKCFFRNDFHQKRCLRQSLVEVFGPSYALSHYIRRVFVIFAKVVAFVVSVIFIVVFGLSPMQSAVCF